MAWRIRHAGATRPVENLTLAQVVDGLRDGSWDAGDLVMGPADKTWITLGDHLQLADAVVLLEPDLPKENDEEERLDMNPLIDVCLVLLVFFMIGVSYLNLPKGHRVPKNKPETPGALRPVTEDQVKSLMIVVTATQGATGPAIMVERNQVAPEDLERELLKFVKDTRKTELLIDAKGVEWGTIIKIIDAAAEAQIKQIHFKAGTVEK